MLVNVKYIYNIFTIMIRHMSGPILRSKKVANRDRLFFPRSIMIDLNIVNVDEAYIIYLYLIYS